MHNEYAPARACEREESLGAFTCMCVRCKSGFMQMSVTHQCAWIFILTHLLACVFTHAHIQTYNHTYTPEPSLHAAYTQAC
jgi:hypothetical protein